ncbi:MAG: tubulin-like doman-containing protein [Lacipirellulaceae bacterium]
MDSNDFPTPQLPGYTLSHRIGAGGYGEVWAAQAPGGLAKAIKYVFGSQLEKRATHELNALEKIKSVRHPFLLSLERIEVIDGRLLVVSELADGSLRDRFRECLSKSYVGIPRDELLGYLADAADALDFLAMQHGLAHLDVKPENLLLVAGHVKVADFGLVKSISQTQASLVGGMTPTYAAPEVFRGSPNRHSDQYSLAILYQEMLTGTVPFPGANAAELTLQHMSHDPDLARLGEEDRFVCARALSKDSNHRYDSAKAFVAALRSGGAAVASAVSFGFAAPETVRPATAESAAPRGSATEVFAEDGTFGDTRKPGAIRFEVPPVESGASRFCTFGSIDTSGFEPSPALFIGIGGTASRVLRALRKRVNQKLGVQGSVPTLPMLLLDTDRQTLAAAGRGGESSGALEARETVAMPLRRPQEYREKSPALLRWLGRRWLYNIPRSMNTEGIRPLGRLALVDHARRAFQCVRGAAVSAVSEESLRTTLEATGVRFRDKALRVYVVASISGGTGSGMSLDVGYAVKSILSRLAIDDAQVIGVLTHSTYRDSTRGELARVNAYSWLSELQQFAKCPTGYPGDAGCGLPAHPAGAVPFDFTYLAPLGNQLDAAAYESAAATVADYLMADAISPAQLALDACRDQPCEGVTSPLLRTFALVGNKEDADAQLDAVQRVVVQRMLADWLRAEPKNGRSDPHAADHGRTTDQVVHGAVAFLGRTQLDAASIATSCRASIEASLGGDAGAFLESRCDDVSESDPRRVAALVDKWFAIDPLTDVPTDIDGTPLAAIATPIRKRLTAEVASWALGRVNDPGERLLGAGRAAEWCVDHVRAVQADLHRVASAVAAERARRLDGWEGADVDDASGIDTLRKLFRLRLDQASLAAAKRVASELYSDAQRLTSELDVVRGLLTDLASSFASTVTADEAAAADCAATDIDRRVQELQDRLEQDYLAPKGGLLAALGTAGSADELRRTIAHVTRQLFSPLGSLLIDDGVAAIDFAPRPWRELGGEHRHVVLTSAASFSSESSQGAAVVASPGEATRLVTEGVGLSLPHVAAELVHSRRDYTLFAERVRTRRDTLWIDPIQDFIAASKTPDSSKVWDWAAGEAMTSATPVAPT